MFEDGDEWEFAALPDGSEPVTSDGSTDGLLKAGFEFPPEGFSLEGTINEIIQRAIAQSGGNVSAAARLLGVPRDYIRYRQKNTGK